MPRYYYKPRAYGKYGYESTIYGVKTIRPKPKPKSESPDNLSSKTLIQIACEKYGLNEKDLEKYLN